MFENIFTYAISASDSGGGWSSFREKFYNQRQRDTPASATTFHADQSS